MADEIQKLRKNIVSNNVLVFVGPDISIYTTNAEQNISHWKHQLKHQQVRRNGKDFRDDMNQSNNTTTEVVGYSSTSDQINHYSNEIGVEETANLMITIGQLFPQNPELIKAIGELQCPIITTNYDLLLEDLLNKVSLTWNEHSNTWDRNDTAYSMAVYLNGFKAKDNWTKIPIFDVNEIYKDSFLTTRIIELVRENRDTRELIAELREQISNEQLCINIRTEASIALIVLGDFDSIQRQDKVLRTNVENRIEELISVLKDPIARYSSHIQNYLLQLYNHMKINQSKYHLNYSNYCRIYLSFIANSGGIPVDTKLLAETVDNMDDKCDLYAEYFVSKMTGNSSGDLRYDVAVLCDKCIRILKSDLIIKSFLKINNTIQIYKPIRSCSWSTDQFPFESFEEDDIPIAFLNSQFYDEKSDELLNESNNLTDNIVDGSLRFQVLEKIYNVAHYKDVKENDFIQHILDKLISTLDQIEKIDDQIIASIRLSFYGCEEFRKKYLRNALEILNEMDENNEKLKLIIKLKPLISIYDDLCEKLDEIVFNLENNEYRYFVNSYYGKILCAKQLNDISDNIELQSLFRLFGQLNDAKIILDKDDNLNQLWLNLYKDINNQLNIEKILKIGINNELFLTSQVAIIIDELIKQGKEERISIIFPYLIKPSNEVLPIVQRWFIDYPNRQIMKLSALLLVETKHIFELVVETLINLLNNDNDQLRYRAQRIFQHPERDPSEPSKTISVIGEKALLKILQGIVMKEHLLKVRVYLRTFFFDVLWDDPLVLKNLCRSIAQSNDVENFHLNRIKFISNHTWNALIQSLQSPSYSLYRENFFESTMRLVERSQIQEQDWIEFQRIFSNIDTNSFVEKLYFIQTDIEIIRSIINEIWSLSNVTDETYFDILQSKIISLSTIEVKNILLENYLSVQNIGRCTFFTSTFNLNQTVLNTLNDLSINVVNIENLIKWLIQNILRSNNWNSRMVSLMIADCLLSLVSACVQKENYLYRKITNASNFNKEQFTKILIEILNHHPCFGARGNAFILLAAMDLSDHKIIINALNTLFDENLVKELATIGIPLIHLSPNEFIDDLLNSLNNDSAIKVYELLKIITQFALDEKIDANCKSNIINYIAKEIGEFKSKRLVNYYYTDIKIPFTTTLENEFYKTWIKIQGLSGKSQYSMTTNE
ncbi:hypothetical protein I4U23_011965 [Adineta vaga]|nr:hypothetical protein I4U23_011965 [Adineta vaga]